MAGKNIGELKIAIGATVDKLTASMKNAENVATKGMAAIKGSFEKSTKSLTELRREYRKLRAQLSKEKIGSKRFKELKKQTILAKQAMDKANKSLGTLGRTSRGVKGSFTKMGNVLKAAFPVVGIYAVVQGLKNLVGGSVKAATQFEQTSKSFEILTGSLETGKNLLDELERFSIKTPFEPAEVQDAAKKMLAFGIETDKVIGYIKNLGELSAATGSDLVELARIFGQSFSENVLKKRDLNQFINAGLPLPSLLRDIGLSQEEVNKATRAGGISFSLVAKAIKKATEEGGRFHGALLKQATTVGGLASTFRGQLNIALRELGNTVLPLLKQILPKLIDIFYGLIDAIKANTGLIRGAFKTTWIILENLFKSAAEIVKQFKDNISESTGESFSFTAALKGLAGVINGIIKALPEFSKILTNSFKKSALEAKALGWEVAAVGSIIAHKGDRTIFNVFTDQAKKLREEAAGISTSWDGVRDSIKAGVEQIKSISTIMSPDVSGIITPERKKESTTGAGGATAPLAAAPLASAPLLETIKILEVVAEKTEAVKMKKLALIETVKLLGESYVSAFVVFTDGINRGTYALIDLGAALGDMAIGFGEAIGKATSFSDVIAGIGGAVFTTLANIMEQLGKAAISMGIAVEAIRTALVSLVGVGAIIAGVALIALSRVIKSKVSKMAPKSFARGGLVYGPTLAIVGDNPRSQGPEVIAPLEKLKDIIGSGSGTRLVGEFTIRGSDLVLALDKAQQQRLRARGF